MSTEYNREHKSTNVNWYLDNVNTLFSKYYKPGTNISMDESMGLFKGCCSFTKRMKNKPISEGHRYYMMVCSINNICVGLVLDNNNRGNKDLPDAMCNIFNKLILNGFIKPLSLIIADNYYSTITLVKYLLSNHNLYYLGTLRKNRLPSDGTLILPRIDQYTYGKQVDGQLELPFAFAESTLKKGNQLVNNMGESESLYCVFRVKDINEFLLITNHPQINKNETMLYYLLFNPPKLLYFLKYCTRLLMHLTCKCGLREKQDLVKKCRYCCLKIPNACFTTTRAEPAPILSNF